MDRRLRSSLLIIRYTKGHYAIYHPGSSGILLTDTLGARAAMWLLQGASEGAVAARVERRAADAQARLSTFLEYLELHGALTSGVSQGTRRNARSRLRAAACLTLSALLSLAALALRWLPVSLLHTCFLLLPKTPLGARAIGLIDAYVDANLCASGYEHTSRKWRRSISVRCAAAALHWSFHLLLSLVLPPKKLRLLNQWLIDPEDMDRLEGTLRASEGGVLVLLHSELFPITSMELALRGSPTALLVDFDAAEAPLSSNEQRRDHHVFERFDIINSKTRMSSRSALERLRRGELVAVTFDVPPQNAESSATIHFLGREVYAASGAAWLAVWSGRPAIFVGTYWKGNRIGIEVAPLAAPDAALSRRQRIAALTTQIYAEGEAFVRRHPEAWMVWSYFERLAVPQAAPLCLEHDVTQHANETNQTTEATRHMDR